MPWVHCLTSCFIDTLHLYTERVYYSISIHQSGHRMTMQDRETIVEPQLTEEQEAVLQRGLRILARMIVRAHLASLIEDDARNNGSGPEKDMNRTVSDDGEILREGDKRVR